VGEAWTHTHLGFEHSKAHSLLGIHAQQKVGHSGDGYTAFLVEMIGQDGMGCSVPLAPSFPGALLALETSSIYVLGTAGGSPRKLWSVIMWEV
jgi:hypothetical protein